MENKSCVHFIGIGGSGMSGLAAIMLEKGYKVTGSDLASSKYVERLRKMGAEIHIGHTQSNILTDCDLVVISTAISENNVELISARNKGIKILKRGELLADLMRGKKSIAIAGAHGKTTTSSMIALILEKNNNDPTVAIGGELVNWSLNARLGNGEYFVAEADESDGSFLKLYPYIAVITNIEDDHLDYYGSKERIYDAFQKFVNNVESGGAVLLCGDSEQVRSLKIAPQIKKETFGLNPDNDYTVKDIVFSSGGTTASVYYKGKLLGNIELSIVGIHNILNALAAISLAGNLGINFSVIKAALKDFQGVKRRFQLLGSCKGVKVVDDYAHHPTEIKTTLKAARQSHTGGLISIFQPHRYSRTKQLFSEFGKSFEDSDLIIITDVFSAGEKLLENFTGETLYAEVKKNYPQKNVRYINFNKLVGYLMENAKNGDMVLTLGAGNIREVGVEYLRKLEEQDCKKK